MKTLNALSMILTVFFIFLTGSVYSGNDGAPVKPGNNLVCSDCTSVETGSFKGVAFTSIERSTVPSDNFTGLMPGAPKEAFFEGPSDLCDTLMLNNLRPAIPPEADFNDDDQIMTIDIRRLAPITPLKAGFEDLR